MRISTICPMVGVCAWWVVPIAQAEIRVFAVEGRVDSISDSLGTLNFTYVGAPMFFQFAFDSEAPDLNETPTLGVYEGIGSRFVIDGIEIPAGIPRIEIQHPRDFFSVGADLTYPETQRAGAGFLLGLGTTDDSLPNVLLPSEPYPLEVFPYTSLGASFEYPNPGSSSPHTLLITGAINGFYLIPEPVTGSLIALGLVLLSLNPRR